MSHQCFSLIRGEHLGFGAKTSFIFFVIHLGITCSHDQKGRTLKIKGQGLGNMGRLAADRLGCQFHCGAGYVKFQDPILDTKCFKICSNFFYSHKKTPHFVLIKEYIIKK